MTRQDRAQYAHAVQHLSSILPANILDGLLQASMEGLHYSPPSPNGTVSTASDLQEPRQQFHCEVTSSWQQPGPMAYTGPSSAPHGHPHWIGLSARFAPGQHVKPAGEHAHATGHRHRRPMARGDHFADAPQSGKRSGAPRLPRRSPRKGGRPAASAIGALLEDLQGVAQERVVKFRKVHVLGSGGLAAIRAHCEAHGHVVDVLALQPPQARRVRPSTLAFVVMSDAPAAASVLAAGHKQDVAGQGLVVEAYKHQEGGRSDDGDGTEASQSLSTPQHGASLHAPRATALAKGLVAVRTDAGQLQEDDIISLSSADLVGENRFNDLEFWPTDDEFD